MWSGVCLPVCGVGDGVSRVSLSWVGRFEHVQWMYVLFRRVVLCYCCVCAIACRGTGGFLRGDAVCLGCAICLVVCFDWWLFSCAGGIEPAALNNYV